MTVVRLDTPMHVKLVTGCLVCTLPACVLSHFSCVWLFVILWAVGRQAPLSMGFSRQEYWCGLPCLPLRDLPRPGIEPVSLALADGFLITGPPGTSWHLLLGGPKSRQLSFSHKCYKRGLGSELAKDQFDFWKLLFFPQLVYITGGRGGRRKKNSALDEESGHRGPLWEGDVLSRQVNK